MRLHRTRGPSTIRWLRNALFAGLLDRLPEPPDRAALATACDQAATQLAARWPAWIDGHAFAAYLAGRLDPGLPAAAAVAEVWIADLYLACAVLAGVPAAVAALDRQLTTELPSVIRTIDPSPDAIDDVIQLLREKLLVPRNGTRRLDSYSGHGPLGAWLRVSALRLALSRRRRRHPEPRPDDEREAILDLAPNAELKVLSRELGADLRAALRNAVEAQPARTRAILRLYYADGHGVEDIGRIYNVHASTVSRWLDKARGDILAQTRADLIERLHTPASQIDSLLGHAASLEISLEGLLRSVEPAR